MRRRGWMLTVAAVLWLGVLLVGSPAWAHAALQGSTPAAGALLDQPPREVVLTFSERPDPSLSAIEVLDQHGQRVTQADPKAVPGAPLRLRLGLPHLEDGVYTVSWRALSAVDGHLTSGAFAFGVGVSSLGEAAHAAAQPHSVRPSALSVAARWTIYWGLALLLGGASTGVLALGGRLPGRRWAPGAAWALAAAGFVGLAVAEAASVRVPVATLLGSPAGARLLRIGVLMVLVAAAVVWAILRPGRRAPLVAVGVTAAGAMLAHVLAGHAGAPASTQWLNIAAQLAHLAAVGVWIGGLAWLLGSILGGETPGRAASVRRFSQVATVALAVVVVTGGLRAYDGVRSVGALLDTGYGLTVLGKVGLFLPLVALGAVNRFRIVPRLARETGRLHLLRRTVGGELLIAVGMFGLAGTLAGLPPAYQSRMHQAEEPAGVEVSGSDFATSIRVRLTIRPGTAGPNDFEVRIEDYDSGEPVDATRVALRVTRPDVGPAVLELRKQAAGRWMGQGTVLAVQGRWRVTVIVEAPPEGYEVPLDVEVGGPATQGGHAP
jgi:copper transport protein